MTDNEPFRIKSQEGKTLIRMLEDVLKGKILDGFLEKFEDARDTFFDCLDDEEAEALDEAVFLLSLYEPDEKIYEAERRQGVLNGKETLQAVEKLLKKIVVE